MERASSGLRSERLQHILLGEIRSILTDEVVVGAVCGMADAHVSMGVAVGTVFATRREIVPGALGGDLGCGMSASRLEGASRAPSRADLEAILAGWSARIPAGDAVFRRAVDAVSLPAGVSLSTRALAHRLPSLLARHLGTLGGGNHFVELDRDADGELWLLVHTGSRGLGAAIAKHHAAAAATSHPSAGGDPLLGLPIDDAPGATALGDLLAAVTFARAAAPVAFSGPAAAHAVSPRSQPTQPAHAASPRSQPTQPAHAVSPRGQPTSGACSLLLP